MITVKLWKDVATFEPIKEDMLDVDGTIDIIMRVKGMTKEETEELPMEDLLPLYLECVSEVNKAVFKNVGKLPKNANGDGQ